MRSTKTPYQRKEAIRRRENARFKWPRGRRSKKNASGCGCVVLLLGSVVGGGTALGAIVMAATVCVYGVGLPTAK